MFIVHCRQLSQLTDHISRIKFSSVTSDQKICEFNLNARLLKCLTGFFGPPVAHGVGLGFFYFSSVPPGGWSTPILTYPLKPSSPISTLWAFERFLGLPSPIYLSLVCCLVHVSRTSGSQLLVQFYSVCYFSVPSPCYLRSPWVSYLGLLLFLTSIHISSSILGGRILILVFGTFCCLLLFSRVLCELSFWPDASHPVSMRSRSSVALHAWHMLLIS